jgi:peptidoglycan/xylan/chitin deacetylase (PgdA/CDA1 family)
VRRRTALGVIGIAGIAGLGAGLATTLGAPAASAPRLRSLGAPPSVPRSISAPIERPPRFLAPSFAKAAAPSGAIFGLPGDAPIVALTVDDGASSQVVAAYAKFASDTGTRITFFINGNRRSWTENAPALRALVETGQVQIANHTWSHPDLRSLSTAKVIDELMLNHDFIAKTFGVDARPYFRPPYGYRNGHVDAAAASVGYTVPVMWYGSLSDASEISDADLLDAAHRWIRPRHIVIGHANFPTVTRHFARLEHIMRERGLAPVTLHDVFARV